MCTSLPSYNKASIKCGHDSLRLKWDWITFTVDFPVGSEQNLQPKVVSTTLDFCSGIRFPDMVSNLICCWTVDSHLHIKTMFFWIILIQRVYFITSKYNTSDTDIYILSKTAFTLSDWWVMYSYLCEWLRQQFLCFLLKLKFLPILPSV